MSETDSAIVARNVQELLFHRCTAIHRIVEVFTSVRSIVTLRMKVKPQTVISDSSDRTWPGATALTERRDFAY